MYKCSSYSGLILLTLNSFIHPNVNGKLAMCQDIPTNYTEPTSSWSLPKNLTFSLKSDQINFFTNIWPNKIKKYKKKHALKPI